MGQRVAGDVYIVSGSVNVGAPTQTLVSAQATTSATVVIISANTTGAQNFTITNFGSINIYVEGSYDGGFFHPSVAVTKMVDNASINTISASTAAKFEGPFNVIRVVAASASGVYRANLTYR